MQKLIIVLCALAAIVVADDHGCGLLQRLKVKQQWYESYGKGLDRLAFGLSLAKTTFSKNEKLRDELKAEGDNLYSPKFKAHVTRVLGELDGLISFLDEEDVFDAQAEILKEERKKEGRSDDYLHDFGDALLEIVPKKLGQAFDYKAWDSCLQVIEEAIKIE